MKTRSYFKTWRMAFFFLSVLVPERQAGCELKRTGSKNPDKTWVLIEDHDYVDPDMEPPKVY